MRQFLNVNGTCSECNIANCFICLDNIACSVCKNGFVPSNNNQSICISCPASCSRCDPSNITKCFGCSQGLYLIN